MNIVSKVTAHEIEYEHGTKVTASKIEYEHGINIK